MECLGIPLEACVSVSHAGFRYSVINEAGSAYIRNKVLRKALDGERELMANGAAGRAGLTTENYEFVEDRARLQPGQASIELRPKRKDSLLIAGHAIVTDPEGDLLRIEGRLTKSPSWWTRSVQISRTYAWRAGTRVSVETSSIADVRLAGRSTFRMTTDYLTNGVDTSAPDGRGRECLVLVDAERTATSGR